MSRVLVTRKVPEEELKRLRCTLEVHPRDSDSAMPRDQLIEEVSEADGIVCFLTERIDESLLERAARLKIVSNVGVGYDNIDVEAATKRGVMVTNTPGVLTEATAELTWGLLQPGSAHCTWDTPLSIGYPI